MDEGIDAGDILLQKVGEINPDGTTVAVYFNKPFPLRVEAMLEAVETKNEFFAGLRVLVIFSAYGSPFTEKNIVDKTAMKI